MRGTRCIAVNAAEADQCLYSAHTPHVISVVPDLAVGLNRCHCIVICRSSIADRDSSHLTALCQQPWPLTPPRTRAPYPLQLRVLSTRLMRKLYRHPFLILVNFLATLVTAVALGLIFRNAGVDTGGIQNRLGCLFFMLLYLSMMSLSSLPIWRAEKLLFIRSATRRAFVRTCVRACVRACVCVCVCLAVSSLCSSSV